MMEIENNSAETMASDDAAVQVHAGLGVNASGTSKDIGTPLTQPRSRAVPRGSWVYFIGAGDAIKIGYSSSPTQRLRSIQGGTHRTLILLAKIPGSTELEKIYHDKFAQFRIRGEWFRPAPPILAEIERIGAVPPKPVQMGVSLNTRAKLRKVRVASSGLESEEAAMAAEILIAQMINRDHADDFSIRATLNRNIVRQSDIFEAVARRYG